MPQSVARFVCPSLCPLVAGCASASGDGGDDMDVRLSPPPTLLATVCELVSGAGREFVRVFSLLSLALRRFFLRCCL